MKKRIKNASESLGAPIELEPFFPYRLSVFDLAVSKFVACLFAARFNISIYEQRCMTVLGGDQPMSSNNVSARTNRDKLHARPVELERRWLETECGQ